MTRSIKITLAWISIVWTACYLAFGLIPGFGPAAMPYLLHTRLPMQNIFTIGNFAIGFVIWNAVAAAGVALAGLLSSLIKA